MVYFINATHLAQMQVIYLRTLPLEQNIARMFCVSVLRIFVKFVRLCEKRKTTTS
jgi:hypothetical protein